MDRFKCEACGYEGPVGPHSPYDCIDTLRDRLAEVEARCADVERERDEARTLAARRNEIAAEWMREHAKLRLALAASQAECARLREAGDIVFARLFYWCEMHGALPEDRAALDAIRAALASAPGSTDALREVCERAWRAGSLHGMGGCNPTDGPPWTEADDKRMAAEVANILGERGKEGGDA